MVLIYYNLVSTAEQYKSKVIQYTCMQFKDEIGIR
jgi:hypothetical protein